jgi:hypothetical protein
MVATVVAAAAAIAATKEVPAETLASLQRFVHLGYSVFLSDRTTR